MSNHRDDMQPMFVGTYDITADIGVYVNTDVRFLAIGGVLIDAADDDAFDRAYDLDRQLDQEYHNASAEAVTA